MIRTTLVSLLSSKKMSRAIRVEETIKKLRRLIVVGASLKTGVITFSVTAEDSDLADQIASRLLEQGNAFNLETRTLRAATERRFTEARLGEVVESLRGAEARLEQFRQENRAIRSSAHLSLDEQRLARAVDMQQQAYTALTQAYEQARFEELRDTPVIPIVERPRAAVVTRTRRKTCPSAEHYIDLRSRVWLQQPRVVFRVMLSEHAPSR